jgi:hypothetical protein
MPSCASKGTKGQATDDLQSNELTYFIQLLFLIHHSTNSSVRKEFGLRSLLFFLRIYEEYTVCFIFFLFEIRAGQITCDSWLIWILVCHNSSWFWFRWNLTWDDNFVCFLTRVWVRVDLLDNSSSDSYTWTCNISYFYLNIICIV